MLARAIVLAALAGTAATAAPAQAAAPGKYDATLTVALVKTAIVHPYRVEADCVTGAYTGTGTPTGHDTSLETVSGTISGGRITGRSVNANGFTWEFSLRATPLGSYSGTWKGFKLDGVLVSEKSVDC